VIIIVSCKAFTGFLQRLAGHAKATGTRMPFGIRFKSAGAFIRQFNYYSFSAIQGTGLTNEDVKVYHHPLFLRDNTAVEDALVQHKKHASLTPQQMALADECKKNLQKTIQALLASGTTVEAIIAANVVSEPSIATDAAVAGAGIVPAAAGNVALADVAGTSAPPSGAAAPVAGVGAASDHWSADSAASDEALWQLYEAFTYHAGHGSMDPALLEAADPSVRALSKAWADRATVDPVLAWSAWNAMLAAVVDVGNKSLAAAMAATTSVGSGETTASESSAADAPGYEAASPQGDAHTAAAAHATASGLVTDGTAGCDCAGTEAATSPMACPADVKPTTGSAKPQLAAPTPAAPAALPTTVASTMVPLLAASGDGTLSTSALDLHTCASSVGGCKRPRPTSGASAASSADGASAGGFGGDAASDRLLAPPAAKRVANETGVPTASHGESTDFDPWAI